MSKKQSAVLSNFNSRCPGEFFEEKIVLSQKISIGKCHTFSGKFLAELSKLHYTCLEELVWETFTFLKFLTYFFVFTLQAKLFGSFTTDIGRVFKLAFSISGGKNLRKK